jgi:hypothetical protein
MRRLPAAVFFRMRAAVSVHLVKLCVGVETAAELAAWQASYLAARKRRGRKPELMHVTRMMPKRAAELIGGGSLYWVIKGQIAVRQRILDLRSVIKKGVPHCGIVYDAEMVATVRRPMRPFQGWRYLSPADAPRDARSLMGAGLPEPLKIELAELGLL